MANLKIKRLFGKNFQGASTIDLQLDGKNAVISGQNGAGKTTRFNLYTWLMCGKSADGKTAEIANFNCDADNIIGEIEFDNGSVFRRESNGTAKFYVDGVPVTSTKYFAAINALTNNATVILSMPFSFSRLPFKDKRNFLMKLTGDFSDSDVIAQNPELAELADLLKKFKTPDNIRKHASDQKKKLSAELIGIPARIEELQNLKVEGNLADVQALIHDLTDKQAAISEKIAANSTQNQSQKIILAELSVGLTKLEGKFLTASSELKRLQKKYVEIATALQGVCPLCGAPVPDDKRAALEADLRECAVQGKSAREDFELFNRALDAAKDEFTQIQKQPTDDKIPSDELKQYRKQLAEIQAALKNAQMTLAKLEMQDANLQRIEQLKAREIQLNDQISTCEKFIHLADLFVTTKINLIEELINAKFQFVNFKMFEDFKTVDGVKECCTATIGGVPYDSLSNGEKLKATLDIIRTLQDFYQVELPIFIDDAESYTSNSFVDLPNQIILLKAVEGVTDIHVDLEGGDSFGRQNSGERFARQLHSA